jgi:hypothetical protein
VLREFEIKPGIAVNLSIMASTIQLTALTFFAGSHYSAKSRADLSPRFALLLAIVGIVTIALATWLRYSNEIVTFPVTRYTPYSILFSMGVLFLSVRALMTASGYVLRGAAFLAVLTTSSYLMADTFAFWLRSYNPAGEYANIRMEMAVYADSPGSEIPLRPDGYKRFKALRAKHHSFLKDNALSVFGSAGYLALGHSLPPANATDNVFCKLMWEWSARNERPEYTMASFRTNDTSQNGVFLAADPHGTIVGFGFAARIHPAQKNIVSLLPKTTKTAPLVYYYARTRGAHLVSAVPCRAPW